MRWSFPSKDFLGLVTTVETVRVDCSSASIIHLRENFHCVDVVHWRHTSNDWLIIRWMVQQWSLVGITTIMYGRHQFFCCFSMMWNFVWSMTTPVWWWAFHFYDSHALWPFLSLYAKFLEKFLARGKEETFPLFQESGTCLVIVRIGVPIRPLSMRVNNAPPRSPAYLPLLFVLRVWGSSYSVYACREWFISSPRERPI